MSSASTSPVMVGRADQLGQLRAAFDAIGDSASATVLLGGEAGVGKTRLVTEFAAHATERGARVVVGQCVDVAGDALSYAPVAGALRDLAAQIGAPRLVEFAGPGRSSLAGLLPELDLEPSVTTSGQGRLFETVTAVLERAAADRPLLLIVEDLHWADRSTRQLLQFVIRALGHARVLLVGTYRSDDIVRTHPLRTLLAELERVRSVQRIEVPRLCEDEVGQQLTGLMGETPALDAVRRVHARSEGVPFLVEQLAGLEAGADLPESLRDLLLVRVERLSADAQQLVRLLAVGRTRVGHDLLAAVTDLDPDPLDTSLREAVSANLLRVDGDGYAFRHALVREVVHDDLLPGEHARLHSRYAATLEERALSGGPAGRGVMAEVAHHWSCAHDQEKSFAASLSAAAEARATAAHAETQHNLERALDLWERIRDPEQQAGVDHVELLARAGSAANNAGETERALALVDAAVDEAQSGPDIDATRLARLLAFKAGLHGDLGRPGAAELIRRGLDLLPTDQPAPMRARLLQKLGARMMMEGRLKEAVEIAGQARALARATGEGAAEFRSLVTLGPSQIQLGHVDDGLATLRAAGELAAGRPDWLITYHINLSDALHLLGRHTEAVDTARAGIDHTREIGLVRTLGAVLTGNTVEPLLALGDWDTAGQLIERGLELDPPGRHGWQILRLHAWLALWRGDIAQATRAADEARRRSAGRDPGPQYVLSLAQAWAQVAIVRGEVNHAWAELIAAVDASPCPQPGYDLPLLATAAWALELCDRAPDSARADAAGLRARLDAIGDWGPSATWRSLADAHLAGLDGPAPDAWQRVLDVVDTDAGPARLRPYARYRLAHAQVSLGDRDAATASLRLAADAADELGAGLVAGWVAVLGRRARIPVRAAPGAATVTDAATGSGVLAALTGREHEVLRLVAAGRSNREIGEELFISAKTASVHVSNILAKLGVSGRGEAAAVAHRAGILDAG